MKLFLNIFLCLFYFQCFIIKIQSTLTFQVEPKTMDCFGIDVNNGEKIKIIFFILRGGLLDIELKVKN